MSLQEEAYADARASQVHESFQPYVRQRLRYNSRLTAISETRRFFILLLGAHGCICASAGYLYNLFSGNLQKKYNLTQTEMSTITTVASIIGLVAFPLASVYDYYGPRPLFVVGMISYPLGSFLFALSFMDVLCGSVFRFTIYCSLQGIGTSMFDISSLMTVMTIFPSSRGAVIAVMKTFIGLGAAIFGICQIGFFKDNIGLFFCAISTYVAIIGFLCFIFVTLPPYHLTGYEEKHLSIVEKYRRLSQKRTYLEQIPPFRRFAIGFAIVVVLIILLPTESALVAFAHLDDGYSKVFAINTICIMCIYSFIAAPISWLDNKVDNSSQVVLQIGEADSETLNLASENVEQDPIREDNTTNRETYHAPDQIDGNSNNRKQEVMEYNKLLVTEKEVKDAFSLEEKKNNSNSTYCRKKENLTVERVNNNINNHDDNGHHLHSYHANSINVLGNNRAIKKVETHKTECTQINFVRENGATFSPSEIARESAILSSYIANTRGSIVDEAVFTMPFVDEAEHIAPQYQTTFIQSLRTLELWVMAYSLFCMVGAQVVIIVNARFIYAAIAEKPISNEVAALLTILNGAGSAVARLLMSIFEIWTQKREPEKRIPLTIALYIPSVCLLLASGSILIIPPSMLIIPFLLTALGNGFYAASTVLVMRTVYAKDVANHYNFLSLASLLATILLNKLLYGSWYTQRAEKQNNTLCSGRDCVFVPFAIITFLQITTLASNWFVHVRYRLFCDQTLAQRQAISSQLAIGENDTVTINDDESQPLLQQNV